MNFLLESIFNIECTRIKRNSHTEKQRRITVSVWLFLKDIVFLWSFLRSLLNSEVPLEGSYIFIYFFSNSSILTMVDVLFVIVSVLPLEYVTVVLK